jgi:hypothetical protein
MGITLTTAKVSNPRQPRRRAVEMVPTCLGFGLCENVGGDEFFR